VYKQLNNPLKRARGAVLVVALIILAVVSILGISNMRSTTLEMRMVGSMASRNEAFALVDAALLRVERELAATVDRDNMRESCTADCFTETCSEGRCFDGEYLVTDDEIGCEVAADAGAAPRSILWQDATLWTDTDRHAVTTVPVIDEDDEDVKYIVEFLCYAASGNLKFDALEGNENNGIGLFRITALYEGGNQRAPVMLQSTYTIAGF